MTKNEMQKEKKEKKNINSLFEKESHVHLMYEKNYISYLRIKSFLKHKDWHSKNNISFEEFDKFLYGLLEMHESCLLDTEKMMRSMTRLVFSSKHFVELARFFMIHLDRKGLLINQKVDPLPTLTCVDYLSSCYPNLSYEDVLQKLEELGEQINKERSLIFKE